MKVPDEGRYVRPLRTETVEEYLALLQREDSEAAVALAEEWIEQTRPYTERFSAKEGSGQFIIED
ncbi:hypothetical protein EI42_06405 [Thermosporothrix hazakensis]|uniref:Uncharacterized protein n=1 Tax=Thermosporothrix hazakensis TaxID=644383 RepID=A0A326TNV3_THEHA|nr:hypothetical protein [Thermosporothrix hazakensis]PZW18035.1 hypothetical protein EI42_06405 [Thermosporothrix hazakensis]GCE50642.1 hypothetical protein KTH_55110 [Thermosporothrix hazakensis]